MIEGAAGVVIVAVALTRSICSGAVLQRWPCSTIRAPVSRRPWWPAYAEDHRGRQRSTKIELFVASLEQPADLTVAIKPFDASGAELGTGGKDGKEARQQKRRRLQNEGPRVLVEHVLGSLGDAGEGSPFKAIQVLKADEAAPAGALVVEGKFLSDGIRGSREALLRRLRGGEVIGRGQRRREGLDRPARSRRFSSAGHRRHGHGRRRFTRQADEFDELAKNIGEDIAKLASRREGLSED